MSLELRALFKTAALRLPHGTCNKGPSVRPTQRNHDRLHCNAATSSEAAILELKIARGQQCVSYYVTCKHLLLHLHFLPTTLVCFIVVSFLLICLTFTCSDPAIVDNPVKYFNNIITIFKICVLYPRECVF